MALRIFDTDPEAKPRERVSFDDGTIGKVHSGKMDGKTPVALDHWEFSTGDADTATALGEYFRAEVIDTRSESENFLRIEDTRTASLDVLLAGPQALTSDMKLWVNGKLLHHCDGERFLSVDNEPGATIGDACGCPRLFNDRKEAAKVFRGPKPSIKLVFALAGAPELGLFSFSTGSWTMAEELWKYEEALGDLEGQGQIAAKLKLEHIEYTTKKGRDVSYFKPVLDRIRSLDDANAE